MKYRHFLFFVCLIIACLDLPVFAEGISSPDVGNISQTTVTTAREITDSDKEPIQIVRMRKELIALTRRILSLEKDRCYFDGILDAQSNNYSTSITVFVSLTFFFIALVGAVNVIIIQRNLKKDIDEATTQIRGEFAAHTKRIEEGIKVKFETIEEENERKFTELEADNCDSIGRLYKDSNPAASAIWFARCLNRYLVVGESDEKWINLKKELIVRGLSRGTPIDNPKIISEFFEIFNNIDDGKNKSLKDELVKALEENIKRRKSSSQSLK